MENKSEAKLLFVFGCGRLSLIEAALAAGGCVAVAIDNICSLQYQGTVQEAPNLEMHK
jgi:hypothetical protein